MTLDESNTYERLLRKSQEAFLLAIELYTAPAFAITLRAVHSSCVMPGS